FRRGCTFSQFHCSSASMEQDHPDGMVDLPHRNEFHSCSRSTYCPARNVILPVPSFPRSKLYYNHLRPPCLPAKSFQRHRSVSESSAHYRNLGFHSCLLPLAVLCTVQNYLLILAECCLTAFFDGIVFVGCIIRFHFTTFFAPPFMLRQFENITVTVHQLTADDVFYAYGATLFPIPGNNKSVIMMAVFAILPEYFIAYVIFVWCCARIAHSLRSFGVKLSTKTLHMQRSFLRMLLLQ
ncbi:hypothetical protein PMAYCL1PPCAC_15271, partial [Pristionchus mayeri]